MPASDELIGRDAMHRLAIDPKLRRTLIYLLNQLANLNRYEVPRSEAELPLFSREWPRVRPGHRVIRMSEGLKPVFHQCVSRLASAAACRDTVSPTTIQAELGNTIEWALDAQLSGGKRPGGEEAIDRLLASIAASCKAHMYYFPLGVGRWPESWVLDLGDTQIFLFSQANLEELTGPLISSQDPRKRQFGTQQQGFIEKTYLGRCCARCKAFGDSLLSHQVAARAAEDAVNLLRFGLAAGNPETIPYAYPSFHLSEDPLVDSEALVELVGEEQTLTHRRSMPATELIANGFDEQSLRQLYELFFFDELCRIARSRSRSAIEERALVACTWVGSAMADRNLDGRFLRLWFAVEAMVGNLQSGDDESVSDKLASRLSHLVLVAGRWHFAPKEAPLRMRRLVALYALRSKIVHRGVRRITSVDDLRDLGTLATSGTLALLDLIQRGVRTGSELLAILQSCEGAGGSLNV
jgi:hypothetical protein